MRPKEIRGVVVHDWRLDADIWIRDAVPPGPVWLRAWLGDDFFAQVIKVSVYGEEVTDGEMERLKGLTHLQILCLLNTKVTDEGVKNLQRALPNCQIEC